jgi:hypothetical protein
MHCVNGACEGAACTFGDPQTCSDDGSYINFCGFAGKQANADCHGQPCLVVSGQARCLPAPIEACGANELSCDGDQIVACADGSGFHFDCADVGQICNNGACATPAETCDEFHDDSCSGTSLTLCVLNAEQSFDCADVGGTCGMLGNGEAGCLID